MIKTTLFFIYLDFFVSVRESGPVPAHLTETPEQDWAGFARILGADGATIRKAEELVPALEKALAANKTFVIDVKTERDAATPVEPYAKGKAAWSYHE